MAGTLVATRYVPPGTYIGQLITPRPGQVADEARLPCFIGRGSRLALGSNLPITRSYIYAQPLSFSALAPFVASLTYASNGDQQSARLFKSDGTEVRRDQWAFRDSGTPGGQLDQVLINTEVFDASGTYYLDYQSTSRDVRDVVPVEDLREIVAIGNQVDQPQYREFEHFYIETDVSAPVADSGNGNTASALAAITADIGNTGVGVVAHASSSQFAHNYTRLYHFEVTAQTMGVLATGSMTMPAGGGGAISDAETFTIDDGVNTASVFEFDVGGGGVTAGNIAVTLTGAETQTQLRDAVVAAINGVAGGLLITAAPGVGAGDITLTADNYGTLANNVITDTVADLGFITAGMAGGVARTITVEWDATAISPGNSALPNTPLHSTATKPNFVVTDDTVASFTPLLELGVRLDFDFGALADNQFDVGDQWTFFAQGPGLFERDARYANTNQFATINDPVADAGNTGAAGTGLSVASTAAFNGTYNANYWLAVTAVVGVAPGTRTTTFVWGEAGDHVGISGTFTADESAAASLTQTLSKGVVLDIDYPTGAGNFAVGDAFTVTAKAPRQLYQGKDNRTYTMTVSSATNSAPGVGFVQGSYTTDTPEGSFGTFEATGNALAPSNPAFEDGHFELPNNVLLAARNLFWLDATGNRHVAADVHTFAATQSGRINWSLSENEAETIEVDEILTDVNGSVTGTANTKYVILANTPTSVTSVVTSVGSTPVSFVHISGTPYVTFASDPGVAIVVSYAWRSAEPAPAQTYFLTAKFLRPAELYNTPTLVLTRQDGRALLAPASVTNHLYVMNEIGWDNGMPGAYFIQVQDPDDDGVYTDADFAEAITASEPPRRVTDVVVLGQFSSLGSVLSSITRMNDPFERRERLCYVGAPIATPIGDAQTPGTLVYTARNTLQVFGQSPAHGTRVMVGSTQATRDVRLDDGTTVEITMDGSFVAGALAALVTSFQDPGATVLRGTLAGFKTIETYGDIEDPRNLALGAAQIIFLTDQGGGVFRIEEDVTVDSFAPDFKFLNQMTQKQYVTRNIRNQTDAGLTGIVVPSAQAGVGLVKGFVVGALSSLVSRGVVARFQDDAGNERQLDPEADVVVFPDATDSSLYHVLYAYWLRTTMKRIFGLYSVNSNDFGLLRG